MEKSGKRSEITTGNEPSHRPRKQVYMCIYMYVHVSTLAVPLYINIGVQEAYCSSGVVLSVMLKHGDMFICGLE